MKGSLPCEGMREKGSRSQLEKSEFRSSFAAISRQSREERVVHGELERHGLFHPSFMYLLTVVGRVIVTAIPFSYPHV